MSGQRRGGAPMAAAVELPTAATSNASRLQRVGLLVLAIFVVVMHHVVGAHGHGDAASMADSHAHSGTAGSVMHAFASGPLGAQERAISSPSMPGARTSVDAGSDASLATEVASPEMAGHAMAMLHLCLAVLAAVVALAALLLIAVALADRTASGITPTAWLPRGPRPPPSARRQARLQVLRL